MHCPENPFQWPSPHVATPQPRLVFNLKPSSHRKWIVLASFRTTNPFSSWAFPQPVGDRFCPSKIIATQEQMGHTSNQTPLTDNFNRPIVTLALFPFTQVDVVTTTCWCSRVCDLVWTFLLWTCFRVFRHFVFSVTICKLTHSMAWLTELTV